MNFFKRLYEIHSVNLPLWLLTTTEIAILNTFFLLVISLFTIGVVSYFPHHVAILADRAWYYLTGDEILVSASSSVTTTVIKTVAQATSTSTVVIGTTF